MSVARIRSTGQLERGRPARVLRDHGRLVVADQVANVVVAAQHVSKQRQQHQHRPQRQDGPVHRCALDPGRIGQARKHAAGHRCERHPENREHGECTLRHPFRELDAHIHRVLAERRNERDADDHDHGVEARDLALGLQVEVDEEDERDHGEAEHLVAVQRQHQHRSEAGEGNELRRDPQSVAQRRCRRDGQGQERDHQRRQQERERPVDVGAVRSRQRHADGEAQDAARPRIVQSPRRCRSGRYGCISRHTTTGRSATSGTDPTDRGSGARPCTRAR